MNASDYAERLKTTGRNDPCPCGSGRKYKHCHLAEDEAARHAELEKAAEERQAALDAAEESGETGEADDDAAASNNAPPRRDEHQRGGRTSKGQDRHANLPRRGAV